MSGAGNPQSGTRSASAGIWRRAAGAGATLAALSVAAIVFAWWRNGWDLEAASEIGSAVSPLVGVLTLLALGAALLSVRMQEMESIRQQAAFLDERQRARNADLRTAYVPFMSAIAEYHEAILEYWNKMLRTGGQAGKEYRLQWQAPSANAHKAVDRLQQSLILVDTDKERNAQRWQLSREIRLEPWVDTKENQRDYCEVLLWRITERTELFVKLRRSLLVEFGLRGDEDDSTADARDAGRNAELRQKAEAIEARISAQLKEQVAAARQHFQG